MERTIILNGKLVALAEMIEADQKQFWEWMQSPELRTLIADSRVPSMEDQMHWFQRATEPDRKFFSVVTISDETLIGNCGFVDIDRKKNEATLRITIGNPASRGKGLGSEAVELLVRYGFEEMKLDRILLKVGSTNERAIKAYQNVGFEEVSKDVKEGKTIITMRLGGNEPPLRKYNSQSRR